MRAHRVVSLLLALAIALPVAAADAPLDAEVDKGIKLVDDGDYDAAIVTLDAAARRLAADPARIRELSQAYLYLGIAYVGKGHEAAAKAKFREAVSRIKDLTLSPDRYPPKVIDLFEAARDEARAAARTAPGPSAPAGAATTTASGPAKKGGGSKTLLIVGGVAAAGGAAALATGGGGGSDGTGGTGNSGPQQLQQSAVVRTGQQQFFTFTTSKGGTVEVKLSWQTRFIKLDIACQDQNPPYTDCGGRYNRTTDTTANYTFTASQKSYLVAVGNYEHTDPAASEPFTIQILYP